MGLAFKTDSDQFLFGHDGGGISGTLLYYTTRHIDNIT